MINILKNKKYIYKTFKFSNRLQFHIGLRIIIYFVPLMILLIAGINIASAAEPLPFKRFMYVNDWTGTLDSKADIDNIMNDSSYMNVDAIMISLSSDYFEAVRNLSYVSWDSRASWNLLEYAIKKAHEKNMQLHVWIPINYVNSDKRAERRLFDHQYDTVLRNGQIYNCWGSTSCTKSDLAFKEIFDYETGLLSFVSKHYTNLDGIHIEEPMYPYTQSYSTAMRDRYTAKYGYDPLGVPENSTIINNINTEQTLVMNEFFTELRKSVNSNKTNPNLLLSANGLHYYSSHTGFNPKYMAQNGLLDWYSAQIYRNVTSDYITAVKSFNAYITEIPIVSIAAIAYATINNNPNPAFSEEINVTCQYGSDAEGIFTYSWRTKIMPNGQNATESLHNIPSQCISTVSTPTFSLKAGNYSTAQNIIISTATLGATLHYTSDGTTPTESSPIYSVLVVISSNTTLKARAWKTGSLPSAIATVTYNIRNDTKSKYDINDDGAINISDLVMASEYFDMSTISPYPKYDVNADGIVNIFDLSLVATNII